MVYKYSWGMKRYPVKAQAAGEYLHEMSEKEGGVTAARVLEVSRAEDALLHPCFEWDDTKAAEAHRLYQARKMIGHLVCTVVKEDPKEEPQKITRAFVSVSPEAKQGVFKPVAEALSDEAEREIVLANARTDAIRFAEKYQALSEFAEVIAAIRRVLSA